MRDDAATSPEDQTGFHVKQVEDRTTEPGATSKYGRLMRLLIALVWAVTLLLLAWLGWRNRDTLLLYVSRANYWRFLLALPFYLGTILVSVIGWSLIMRALARPVSLWMHFRIYCTTLAARRLPGTLWYVGGRLALYSQLGISRTVVSLASAVELVITTVAGVVVGLLLLPLGLSLPGQVIAILAAGAAGGIICLHPVLLARLLRRLGQPLARPIRWIDLLKWLLAYATAWLLAGLMLGQIIGAFWQLDLRHLAFIVAAFALAGSGGLLTIFLPSSFGVTELALTFFLAQVMPTPLAATVAITTRIYTTLAEVLLSIAISPFLRQSQNQMAQPDPEPTPKAPGG